ncbi:DUF445 domain-containing protein [Pseudalkalibacillus salsuginis]|uniref:DUF445 domain-containing protein n=1 Tax=Pseudalkalibacillus salsuginis TaxID=2910972 RepID=UPI001F217232|nr:DUF445 family protein [Pseudalkalibacillus salsuginis]MCF6411015.1 DUF445 family protein [Pseudalkalibacillus salsuginis]
MEFILIILMMVAIGATIGGFTNSLAIKMLFRPYQALYIGRYKLPFTPGLIPKRREELAVQLGQMVVNHLITKEGLQQKLAQSHFKNELVKWAQSEVSKQLETDKSINDLASDLLKQDHFNDKFDEKLKTFILERARVTFGRLEEKPIKALITESVNLRIESYIPHTTKFIQNRMVDFVISAEGKQQLKQLIDEFLAGRGMLGNMLNMFLGNESLVDKVQAELIKILKKDTVAQMMERILVKEWHMLKERPLAEFIDLFKLRDVEGKVVEWAVEQLDTETLFSKPVSEIIQPYRPKIEMELVPEIVDRSLGWVGTHMEKIMEKLQLSELVRQQVGTFSVQRLEEMVLSISRRELKMITYLGALLGGIIGFIQGLMVYFMT